MYSQQKPVLIIMAAGMGSRFGGLKQLTPVGPGGEMIIDYSIYDAKRAGFGRVVFVIKREMEQLFKEKIGNRVAQYLPVSYVYQELTNLPCETVVPEGRVKPWGTGHAVLCCADVVNEPFMVINADDFYGKECFAKLYAFLMQSHTDTVKHMAMAGYLLKNTVSENGYVSRGIATVNAEGYLTDLVERTHIELREGKPQFTEDDGQTWEVLSGDTLVSMNCWALPAGTLNSFGTLFADFLQHMKNSVKDEFYLPFAISSMVESGEADVQVLATTDKWYGMTYADDKQMVMDAIAEMVEQGIYPARLWA